ncbi:MAG: hypothetical protein R3Y24_07780 [Eubacteriales bacterium]
MTTSNNKRNFYTVAILTFILVLQFLVALYFCEQKQGFHYDEYYSYYSSNVTYGLVLTDREWKDISQVTSEFIVAEDSKFQYGMVTLMQSYDVHPPLYYWILHTVSSLFSGIFSKWLGLSINLACFVISYYLFAYICSKICKEHIYMTFMLCGLWGFSAGILSGITFIRMYMLLLVWCLSATCIHIKGLFAPKNSMLQSMFQFYLPVFLISFLGLMTHYYFLIFMFFLAAYSCFALLITHKSIKPCIPYGISVMAGIFLAIFIYPSSLSHMFRGYRGNEATEAFFTLSNTWERISFFAGLLNDFVFNGLFFVLFVLCLQLFILSVSLFQKQDKKKEFLIYFFNTNREFLIISLTSISYFLVVAKTALLNAEEATRYELPVFGFALLIILFTIFKLSNYIMNNQKVLHSKKNIPTALISCIFFIMLLFGSFNLYSHNVQFLYENDRENVMWAKEHRDDCVVYLYNPTNLWMIWDESEELMQYSEIYFVNTSDFSPINDDKIKEAAKIYVYASRNDVYDLMLQDIIDSNSNLTTYTLERELLYCDLYALY